MDSTWTINRGTAMNYKDEDLRDLREAAVRPIVQPGRRSRQLIVVLGAIVLAGLVAYGYQLWHGLGVTGLNNNVFWGFYFTDFIAFIGISYGGAIVSAVLRLTGSAWRAPITRLAEAMALVSLLIGASFAMVDLGRPERIWEFLVSPNFGSPVVWDLMAISTYLLATLLFFYLPLIPDLALCQDSLGSKLNGWRRKLYGVLSLGWRDLPQQRQRLAFGVGIISIAIIPLAVSVHSVMAWAFSVTSRTGWHSTIFGPYYVVAALFSGVAAVILVTAAFRKAYHLEKYIGEKQIRYLGYLMLALGLTYLYFTFSEFLTEGYVLSEESVPLLDSLLLHGYAPLFWFFVVAAGVVPVLLVAIPRWRTSRSIIVAATLAVAGMWVKRFLIIVPTLRQAVLPSATLSYSPTWVEVSITLGALAAIPLLLILIFRIFPVISVYEMEEVAAKDRDSEPEPESAAKVPVGQGGRL